MVNFNTYYHQVILALKVAEAKRFLQDDPKLGQKNRCGPNPLISNSCTIDISKVLDSVKHMQAMNALLHNEASSSIVITLKFWNENLTVLAKWKDTKSDPVKIRRGVSQASILSHLFFKHAISKILDCISPSLLLHGTELSYLAYTDDVLLLVRSKADLQDNLNQLLSDF
ncbi:hypothetical protein QYM36_002441 [Artemia franciscana]|uniref:Reverse transcriptase domain-containing protein n=1 Tax=Artemia franciscana TaxID=6661 RepID=A0AA88LJG0_ARTSF|nr:hypothetical protein QYM36_002441 [Artemia franciscana]